MIKIEVDSPDDMIGNLLEILTVLRVSGSPIELRHTVSGLVKDIRSSVADLVEGETL